MKKILVLLITLSCLSLSHAQVISRLIGNERLGKKDSVANWTIHFQFTGIMQGHPAFKAAYSGTNSLQSNADNGKFSITSTIFLGRKLWKGAAIYADAEVAGGEGMSFTRGIAGFPNGETFRIGDPSPAIYIARAFFQQNIALKNSGSDVQSSDINQLAGKIPSSRITITVGKICMADFFDDNAYSHDPRSQFFNWALMNNGAWDYAANTRGYTPAVVIELIKPKWALRIATALMPRMANGPKMDWHWYKSNSETIEYERHWRIKDHPGTARVLGFISFDRAPSYKSGLAALNTGDKIIPQVINGALEWNTYGGIKYGFGLNVDQELTDYLGVFARGSWNDGHYVTWAFAEIDHSFTAGINVTGQKWKRPADNIGLAGVFNGISPDHRVYLQAGGYGFMVGDGTLHYGNEGIIEVFYKAKIASFLWATLDYQFVVNPAYNTERGPVHVLGARVHIEI